MLSVLGFAMVLVFMTLIMTKRLSPMVALIVVPILFALIAGLQPDAIGEMVLDGIKAIAPTGIMLMFAILYFAIMIDAGMFDPIIKIVIRLVDGDPAKVVIGTAVLATLVSLDGDGSTTYMVTVASMLPLYLRLGMNPIYLTCITMLASGVMNLTPWGGPLARAASALRVETSDVFVPLLPSMAIGVGGIMALAYFFGRWEKQRLGSLAIVSRLRRKPEMETVHAGFAPDEDSERHGDEAEHPYTPDETDAEFGRPGRLWFNLLLTATLMASLILQVLPMAVLFMVGLAVALVANYPNVDMQRERIAEHAKNVIAVVSLVFAAGVFTGILAGAGMTEAMSESFLAAIPTGWGPYLAPITALASMPFTFFISNDAFYFGVLPIIAEAASVSGISNVEIARASLMGQPVHLLSPLVASTYLLVGLAGVDFGDHQRFALKWTIAISLLMTLASLLTGAFPFVAR